MFAHLHLHAQYSLLDGACRIDQLADTFIGLEQTNCALTDYGTMCGAVVFTTSLLAELGSSLQIT